MNWILLGICALTGLTLISCNSVGTGPSVDDPTVQQMSDLEKQWGLPDRKIHSHGAGNSNDQPIAPEPRSVSVPAATSSESSPAPQLVTPADPVDAGTIKKLQ